MIPVCPVDFPHGDSFGESGFEPLHPDAVEGLQPRVGDGIIRGEEDVRRAAVDLFVCVQRIIDEFLPYLLVEHEDELVPGGKAVDEFLLCHLPGELLPEPVELPAEVHLCDGEHTGDEQICHDEPEGTLLMQDFVEVQPLLGVRFRDEARIDTAVVLRELLPGDFLHANLISDVCNECIHVVDGPDVPDAFSHERVEPCREVPAGEVTDYKV